MIESQEGLETSKIRDLLKNGQYDEAEKLAYELTKLDRLDPEPVALMGDVLVAKKAYQLAIKNYEMACQLAEIQPKYDQLLPIYKDKIDFVKDGVAALRKIDERKAEVMDLFGTQDNNLPSLAQETAEKNVGQSFLTRHVLHPYFGFARRFYSDDDERLDGTSGFFNKHGYIYRTKNDRVEYPYNGTTDNPFIVGVFGGSVGANFHLDQFERIANALKEHPKLKEREIIVLKFAQGAFEQPQHMLALAYFISIGQRFDLVISLDGFNEASGKRVNQINGLAPSMPQWGVMRALRLVFQTTKLGSEAAYYQGTIYLLQAKIERLRGLLRHPILKYIVKPRFEYLSKKFEKLSRNAPYVVMGDKDDILMLQKRDILPLDVIRSDENVRADAVQEVVDLWKKSSFVMAALCEQVGAKYIQALQPNQYFSKKEFSPEEVEKYYNPDLFYAEAVRDTYPVMIAAADFFAKNGINFIDLTPCVDSEKTTVLTDDVCHFNAIGNERMGDLIIPKILEII